MRAMTLESFIADEKAYEIRLLIEGDEYVVRAFHDDRPANGFSYRVSFENQFDFRVIAGQDMIKELTRIAKNDVVEKKYEELVNALKDSGY